MINNFLKESQLFSLSLTLAINLSINFLYGNDNINPILKITNQNSINDFIIFKNKIYIADNNGQISIQTLNINNQEEKVEFINLPKISNFYINSVEPKIYSVDIFNNKILIVVESDNGLRNILLANISDLKPIKIYSSKEPIKEARFIDSKNIFFGNIGGEIVLFNLEKNKEIYRKSLSSSTLSDIAIDTNKKISAISFESGEIIIVDSISGNIIKTLSGLNQDNVYQVCIKNDIVIGGGQDRKLAVYSKNRNYFINTPFLIYSVAISPNEKYGAFSFGEDNLIKIFDINSGEIITTLSGLESTPNKIEFIDNDTIFASSEDKIILKWSINK